MKERILLFSIFLLTYFPSWSQLVVEDFTNDVGIGTTNPEFDLHIEDNGGPADFLIHRNDQYNTFTKASAGQNGTGFIFNKLKFWIVTPGDDIADNTADVPNSFVVRGNGNIGIGVIDPNHKLHVNGDIYRTGALLGSDKRLKSNISSFKYGLNELLRISPISYTYNGKGGTTKGEKHIGIIAQELQQLVPDLVQAFEHTEYKEYDLNKEPKVKSKETYLAIKDNEIKYLMINAIKDQQALIEDQQVQIEELRSLVEGSVLEHEGVNTTRVSFDGITKDNPYLFQNVPNPSNNTTSITYYLPEHNSGKIVFLNNLGAIIKTVELQESGKGQLVLDLENLPSGSYTYSLVVGGNTIDTKKMIISN